MRKRTGDNVRTTRSDCWNTRCPVGGWLQRTWLRKFVGLILCLMSGWQCSSPGSAQEQSAPKPGFQRKTQNVLLITLDGLRWQEVFGGVDLSLMNKESGGVRDLNSLQTRFVRPTAKESREALMPFFWNTLATQGVIFGDPDHKSRAEVSNGLNFSYPGYSEILCGFADPAIDSNAKKNNPNVTVLEWLHQKPEFQDSVAAFTSWDVFPFIIHETRSGIPVNAGWEALSTDTSLKLQNTPAAAALQMLDQLATEVPQYWPEVRYDFWTFRAAEEYLKARHPRLLYVSLGETDDWAHAGRYDLYLDSAFRNDQYISRLWQLMQSLPEYRDRTTLILTTDHGRGDNQVDWKSHGAEIDDCQYIWMAVIGPDTKHQIISEITVTQSQVAATVAGCLGYDYQSAVPQAAAPLPVLQLKE